MSPRLISSFVIGLVLMTGAASAQTDMRSPGGASGAPTHQAIPAPPPAPTGTGVVSPLKTLPPPPPAPAPQLLNPPQAAPVAQPNPAGGEWRRHFESPARNRAPAAQPHSPAPAAAAPVAAPPVAASPTPHASAPVETRAPRAEAPAPRAKPRKPHRPRRPLAPPAPEFFDGGFAEPPPLWSAPYDTRYVAPGPYYSEPRPGFYRRAPVIDDEGCVLRKKRVRVNGRWVRRWVRFCR